MKFLPRLAAAGLTLSAAVVPAFTLGLAPTFIPAACAAEAEASFDVFYNNLADQGDWYNTPDYGYVWQPYIAYKNDQWRPYTDGYWAQTDQGWTWVSYEDFGWACYHYGRWSQLEGTGWVWVPGYEWGPGWVSWRTGDDYVGWAPLPPKRERRVGYVEKVDSSSEEPAPPPRAVAPAPRVLEGRVVDYGDVEEDYDVGYNAGVDVAYDIGPSHYCFVPVQNFGAPYIREFIVPPVQNVVIIERTTNVTNIVYRHGSHGGGARDRVVYCGGPDYNFISERTERPVPRLLLERRADVAYDRAALRADQFNIIRDNRLEIAAPLIARRPSNPEQLRPARIKETLDRPQPLHGWRSAEQQDPRLVERLRTQFQQQARQAPPARVAAERFITPAAFRAQPPPPIQQQQAAGPRGGPNRAAPLPAGAAGFNANPNPAAAAANVPPAPAGPTQGRPLRPGQPPPPTAGNPPTPAGAQPAPPNGRALTDAERQAKRDTKLREMQERQRGREAAGAPATPPGGAVSPPKPAATNPSPAAAAAATDRKGRTPEEREAYRAAKQQPQTPRSRDEAPAPKAPAQPSQAQAEAERAKEERRAARQNQAQPAAPSGQSAAEQQAKEERRAARQQEQARGAAAAEQRQAAQQQQQQQAAHTREDNQRQQRAAERAQAQQSQQAEQQRSAAREQRQQAAAQQQQQQQAQQQQRAEAAGRAREAQQAQRQQQQQPPPEQRRPAAQQPAAQPSQGGGNPEEERKHKHRPDGQPQ